LTTITATVPVRTERSFADWLGRWAGVGGLLFVAGFIVLFLTPAGGDSGDTPQEVVAYARANDGWLLAGTIFFLASVGLLACFVAGVYARLQAVLRPVEAALVAIGGTVFTVLCTIALVIWLVPLIDMPTGDARAIAQAEAFLAVDDVGWVLFAAAGVGAAVMAIPATLAAMRTRAVPTWLCWLGLAAGIGSLATGAFFGMFAWLAWIAGASAVMLVRRS
jgi:hypothetical protein